MTLVHKFFRATILAAILATFLVLVRLPRLRSPRPIYALFQRATTASAPLESRDYDREAEPGRPGFIAQGNELRELFQDANLVDTGRGASPSSTVAGKPDQAERRSGIEGRREEAPASREERRVRERIAPRRTPSSGITVSPEALLEQTGRPTSSIAQPRIEASPFRP